MSKIIYPVLCGGTFFTLVLESRKQRTSKRSQHRGELDGLSQPEIFAALGRIVYPEYSEPKSQDTFRTNVSNYKACENNGTNLSFLCAQEVSAFDNHVKTKYLTPLGALCDFVSCFLDVGTSTAKEVWLVKAFLDLINADQSIDDSQEFYIRENGQSITKAALRNMNDFCFQSFLLGVWHFVIVNRPNNKTGKTTYDTWCPSRGRAERKYIGTLGDNITRPISVLLWGSDIEPETATANGDDPSNYDEPFAKDSFSKTTGQMVNNPIIFNQYGHNSVQIGSIDTITIYNAGGDKNEK